MQNDLFKKIAILIFDIGLFLWMYFNTADFVFVGSIFAGPIILLMWVFLVKSDRVGHWLNFYRNILLKYTRILLTFIVLAQYLFFERSVFFKTMGVRKSGLEIGFGISYVIIFAIAFFLGLVFLIINLVDLFYKEDKVIRLISGKQGFSIVVIFYIFSMLLLGYIAVNYY